MVTWICVTWSSCKSVSYLVKRLVQANSESAVDKEETAQVEMTFEYVDFVEMPENLDYLRSSCVCVLSLLMV